MAVSFSVDEHLDQPLEICLTYLAEYWEATGIGSRLVRKRSRGHFRLESTRWALFPVTGEVRLRSVGRHRTAIMARGTVDIINFPFASRIAGEIVKRGIRNGDAFLAERSADVA